MPDDIIDEIDRLYVEEHEAFTKPNAAAYAIHEMALSSALRKSWPTLRDRLRDAERKAKIALDELGNIARVRPYAGPEPWADDFIPWAQSRARDAIESALRGDNNTDNAAQQQKD